MVFFKFCDGGDADEVGADSVAISSVSLVDVDTSSFSAILQTSSSEATQSLSPTSSSMSLLSTSLTSSHSLTTGRDGCRFGCSFCVGSSASTFPSLLAIKQAYAYSVHLKSI
jgi:hypothetical protein